MAEANPLRYRGYYYDRETEFYYLNSRYYDPKTGRFINADSYVSTGQGIMGYNMFAYCGNNPVNRSDTEGRFWDTFVDFISLGASLIDVWNNPKDGWAWAGLGGDAVDLIPFVTGVGEGTKALGAVWMESIKQPGSKEPGLLLFIITIFMERPAYGDAVYLHIRA